jgi:hypothetical protein
MSEDTVITIDSEKELGFAIGKASQRAKQTGNIVWVYSKDLFFWMTEGKPPENAERVAKCYPGGRNILMRKPE